MMGLADGGGEKVHLNEGAGRTSRKDGAEASRSSS